MTKNPNPGNVFFIVFFVYYYYFFFGGGTRIIIVIIFIMYFLQSTFPNKTIMSELSSKCILTKSRSINPNPVFFLGGEWGRRTGGAVQLWTLR